MTKVVLKWSKWLSLIVLGLVLALLLALVVVLFSKPGLSLVVWGADRFVPQLTIGSHQGSIFPRFTLNDVAFKDDQLHVDAQIKSLTLAIKPACFTEPSVCIDELSAQGVQFSMPQLPESEPSSEPDSAASSTITSPLPIRVGRILLQDVALDVLGNQVRWETFATGLIFQGNRLSINKTRFDGGVVKLAPATPEQSSTNQSDNATVKNSDSQPIELPDVVLPLSVDVTQLDISNFKLDQAEPVIIHQLALKALASQSSVKVSQLDVDMPQLKAGLTGEVTLNHGYPLDLSLDALVKMAPVNGQKLTLKATGSVEKLKLEAKLRQLIQADLSAELEPLDPNLPFQIALKKGKAQWPLTGKADYQALINQFNAQGSLAGYQLDLDGNAKGQAIPEVDLTLAGKGDLSEIHLSALDIKTLGGEIKGSAMANWQAPINWAADLTLANIQPGLQWSEAEGNLSGALKTDGSLTQQGGWQVNLPMLDIDGVLRQYPLNVVGSLKASDKKGVGDIHLETPKLVLSHGPNQIEAKGKLEQQWNMDVRLNLPELAKSIPELQGSALGDLSLRGKLSEPEVGVNLAVNNIDWRGEAQVKSVRLQGDVVPLPLPHGKVNLKVAQINYQGNLIDDVELNIGGNQDAHELSLEVNSELLSTRLAISGNLTDKPHLVWQGQLARMMIRTQQGDWNLNQATAVTFDFASQMAAVGAHCWQQNDSSVCLDKDIQVGESGEAQFSVKQFDFKQLSMFMPEKTELSGSVEGQVWAKWAPQQAPQLKASITMPTGQVKQMLDKPLVFGWDSVKINADVANNQLKADWLFDVTDNGDVSGQVTIPDVTAQDKQMDGQLALSTFNLDFLNVLVGEYSQLKSNIQTDLRFSGPLLHPQVNGQFVVDDMLLHGDISPIDIDSGRLAIEFNGYNAKLNAAIQTPDGKLNVTGDGDWQDLQDWRSHVRVFADELQVNLPPMVRIKVIPDMTISAQPNLARIDGNIALPWGRIVIDELPPSAVGISKDLVLVDSKGKPLKSDSTVPFEVETNIKIKIGDDFKLSAFGLEGGLVGNLKVVQKNKGPFVTGEVNIVDGSYQSFGQDLLIKEGKILMNGPVDQPYVQITAIRNPDNTQDDVTAGVKVVGPADEPQLTIFSDPAMPQANALSYLLRGQDIDGESGGNAMTTTLIGLSLAKSGKVVGELGQAFGVQDLQLDTAGSGDDSQVTVSGYVLPGLQVKYGVGIFDSVGEFTVRYRLMKDLYLEVVSGLDSAVDLLYQFEFN
ncbi:translocation/assembly module TamB [Vibrio scophthalmi]|uniref:autotransporter assembly complex protein TamB n=1 Tax=Vibrio scophthalmi TaxID=45658 RepID=UPI0022853569|nr:translocation/assembly module TamB domain-containing protein [Vibrio scophthalmi]MCY9805743.1 translocation/assembly module TamB [Vibrio scophthalmi]